MAISGHAHPRDTAPPGAGARDTDPRDAAPPGVGLGGVDPAGALPGPAGQEGGKWSRVRRHPVGIVVVSHSRTLAEGAAELAREIGLGLVPVEAAGGDIDGGLGASYELIERAVQAADRGAGVVLLADIGSSVLTARAYAEDATDAAEARAEEREDAEAADAGRQPGGPDAAEQVRITPPGPPVIVADAPLIEGAVAAASAAASGADLTAVVTAAGDAYNYRKL